MSNPFAAIASDKVYKLIEVTAKFTDLQVEDLCTQREAPVFLARATAMWIMRYKLNASCSEISRAFGKDRKTITNALQRAESMIESNSMFRQLKDELVKRLDQ